VRLADTSPQGSCFEVSFTGIDPNGGAEAGTVASGAGAAGGAERDDRAAAVGQP
jgi:hypothetical protein